MNKYVYYCIRSILCRLRKNNNVEYVKSFGEDNPDKVFFIIRREYSGAGLFSIFNTHLGWIKYAVDRGLIPVIDMQNYPNAYLDDDKVGRVNAWEYYFEQPGGYSLSDINTSKRVIFSSMDPPKRRPDDHMCFYDNKDGELDYWRGFVNKHIRVKRDIVSEVEKEWNDLFSHCNSILGVCIRGTDYIIKKPKGHPKQPSLEKVLIKIREVLREHTIDSILLCTEDTHIIEIMKENFGDLIRMIDREYIVYDGGSTPNTRIEREDDRYIQGRDYLKQMLALAKCDRVIISRTSGTVGMACFSKGWIYSHIFDLGRY